MFEKLGETFSSIPQKDGSNGNEKNDACVVDVTIPKPQTTTANLEEVEGIGAFLNEQQPV